MKITVEADSLEELVELLEQIKGNAPAPSGAKIHIDALPLSPRTKNALLAKGIDSISQLTAMNDAELKLLPDVGAKAIAEIRGALASRQGQ